MSVRWGNTRGQWGLDGHFVRAPAAFLLSLSVEEMMIPSLRHLGTAAGRAEFQSELLITLNQTLSLYMPVILVLLVGGGRALFATASLLFPAWLSWILYVVWCSFWVLLGLIVMIVVVQSGRWLLYLRDNSTAQSSDPIVQSPEQIESFHQVPNYNATSVQ